MDSLLSISVREGTPVRPPMMSGRGGILGHAAEFAQDCTAMMERGYRENGPAFSFRLGIRTFDVLVGPEFNRFYWDQTDKSLDMARGMQFLKPLFSNKFWVWAGHEEYLRQRAIVFPKFKVAEMRRYAGVMTEEIDRLVGDLGEEGTVEIAPALGPTIMYIAAHAFLGRAFREKFSTRYFDMFREFSLGIEGLLPLWLHWLPTGNRRRGWRGKAFFRRKLNAWMAERRARPVDPPDFFQDLLAARYDDGSPVPDSVIFQLIMFMTWAGHETTTAQTAWALTDLMLHPEWLQKVRAEVDDVLGDTPVRNVSWAQLGALKTIDLAIRESERLHPIATMLQRVARQDIDIAGYRIPKGDRVVVVPSLSHLDAREFPDPEAYRPDRFDPNGECPANMDSLIGFGGGVHRCLGVNFARLEMKALIAILVQHFDMVLLDEVRRPKGLQSPWPESPCRMAYRLRPTVGGGRRPRIEAAAGCPVAH